MFCLFGVVLRCCFDVFCLLCWGCLFFVVMIFVWLFVLLFVVTMRFVVCFFVLYMCFFCGLLWLCVCVCDCLFCVCFMLL